SFGHREQDPLAGRAAGEDAVDAALGEEAGEGTDSVLVEVAAAVGQGRHRRFDPSGEDARDAIDPWFPSRPSGYGSQDAGTQRPATLPRVWEGRLHGRRLRGSRAGRDGAPADRRQLRGPPVLVRARGPRYRARDRRRRPVDGRGAWQRGGHRPRRRTREGAAGRVKGRAGGGGGAMIRLETP